MFDLEMLETTGFCSGIENYSRYIAGRNPGEPPPTLFEYLPDNALLIVDESHVTIPQLGGMYRGDRSRKETLVEYGFRLPSALDNRPLNFDEFTTYTLNTANMPPFGDTLGLLDAHGKATATVTVPPAAPPSLQGLSIHFAYAALDPMTGQPTFASNAEPLGFTP